MRDWHELTGDSFREAQSVPLETIKRFLAFAKEEEEQKARDKLKNAKPKQ